MKKQTDGRTTGTDRQPRTYPNGETSSGRVVRLAALADTHCGKMSAGTLAPLFGEIAKVADILVVCGDLTDYGLPEEAEIFVKELSSAARLPTVAVLGNHDCEAGRQDEIRQVVTEAGIQLLDGESCEVLGIGFAGIKGFCGGFGRGALGYWGESAIKAFVQETLDETLKLESALARLRTPQRVAVLHYSPIRQTVEGEPLEIYPYLGSSRLEEPLNRYPVSTVLHGHAHNGAPEGETSRGVPVYNVSMSLLQKTYPDRLPFRLIEIPVLAGATVAATS